MRKVRDGNVQPIVFWLRYRDANKVSHPYDLSTATKVTLHRLSRNRDKTSINTVDNPSNLAITDDINGEVTLTPSATFWKYADGWYDIWFRTIDTGATVDNPEAEVENFMVTEGA